LHERPGGCAATKRRRSMLALDRVRADLARVEGSVRGCFDDPGVAER
jgi:hypothetical protein